MYYKTPKGRVPKGAVAIKAPSGRLQLIWRFQERRYYLAIGLPDTPVNRSYAESIARQIENDIATGNFDSSKRKYDPKREPTSKAVEPKVKPIELMQVWLQFVEFKRPQLAESTIHLQYDLYTKYLERCPYKLLMEAPQVRDWLIKEIPIGTAKRVLVRLNAMGEWAITSGKTPANPFAGLQKIAIPKGKKSKPKIEKFTLEERDLILEALGDNRFVSKHSVVNHSFYRNFVAFLFLTGCRPSEAIALEWRHLSRDFTTLTFEQSVMTLPSGSKVTPGTKTEPSRIFPCNNQLQALLKIQWSPISQPNDLIFPGVGGALMNLSNFNHKVWRPILKKLGLKSLRLYACRHSFITWSLDAEMRVQDIAAIVGNSPEVIYEHYLAPTKHIEVPEF